MDGDAAHHGAQPLSIPAVKRDDCDAIACNWPAIHQSGARLAGYNGRHSHVGPTLGGVHHPSRLPGQRQVICQVMATCL